MDVKLTLLFAAWVGSLAISSSGIFGPVAGKLCKRLGPRLMVICGTLLSVAGLLLTTQVPSISWMYLTYGGVFGLGSSAIFISIFLEVPKHFIKRRSLATGLIAMGPGGGLFVMSPIVQVLLDALEWRYTLVTMAGIVSVTCFIGCTFSKRLSDNNYEEQTVSSLVKDRENKHTTRTARLSFLRNPFFLFYTIMCAMGFIGHTIPAVHMVC